MAKSDDPGDVIDDKNDDSIIPGKDNIEFSDPSRFEKSIKQSYSPDINDLNEDDPPQGSETSQDKESE